LAVVYKLFTLALSTELKYLICSANVIYQQISRQIRLKIICSVKLLDILKKVRFIGFRRVTCFGISLQEHHRRNRQPP